MPIADEQIDRQLLAQSQDKRIHRRADALRPDVGSESYDTPQSVHPNAGMLD